MFFWFLVIFLLRVVFKKSPVLLFFHFWRNLEGPSKVFTDILRCLKHQIWDKRTSLRHFHSNGLRFFCEHFWLFFAHDQLVRFDFFPSAATAGAPSRRKRFCMRFVDPIPGPPWNSIGTARQRADAFWCWKILLLPLAPNINVAKTCNLTCHVTFQAVCPGNIKKATKDNQTKTTTK